MPQSLAKVLVHLIFATKKRHPFLSNKVFRDEMHRYLGGTLNKLGCPALIVGGSVEHVHLLFALSRNNSLAYLVRELKRGSSKWIKTKDRRMLKFSWQIGYGVFSVSQSQATKVIEYIKRQEDHHQITKYEHEYIAFLKKYEINYNEQFVWD
jgi:putative transposase